MKKGAELLRWARGVASDWWERRHDPNREPLADVIAAVYLQGAIDALNNETVRHTETGPRPAQ